MKPENLFGKIVGKYKIKKIIGEGAFSTVCLAREIIPTIEDHDNNHMESKENTENKISQSKNNLTEIKQKKYVACKIIPRTKIDEKKMTTRLDQEIRIHQMMHHPNVVQLLDVQKDSLYYYIFLEFCECGELFQIIIKKHQLTEYEAAVYFKQILIGLQYIHSLNVAHRDLKPENILVNGIGQVKIADFGLSKLLKDNGKELTNTPCGSPCYTSPEIISGHPYDGKISDIWSCGVILYALTTGFLPWTEKVQSKLFGQIKKGDFSVPPFISNTCADLIYRLMTVDPKKRITIEDALNHPFLKDVAVPSSTFDRKYVSLRKVDRFLSLDRCFEYSDLIDHISKENSKSDSKYNETYYKVIKDIETDDEKKKKREKMHRISLIPRPRKNPAIELEKYNRKSFMVQRTDLNDKINPIPQQKIRRRNDITINLTLPYLVSPKKLNSRFKFMNQFGIPSLSPRRSEQNQIPTNQ